MSGLDLRTRLFLTPKETAALFRRSVAWTYKAGKPGGFLERAVWRDGHGNTLFRISVLEELATVSQSPKSAQRWSPGTRAKHEHRHAAKR